MPAFRGLLAPVGPAWNPTSKAWRLRQSARERFTGLDPAPPLVVPPSPTIQRLPVALAAYGYGTTDGLTKSDAAKVAEVIADQRAARGARGTQPLRDAKGAALTQELHLLDNWLAQVELATEHARQFVGDPAHEHHLLLLRNLRLLPSQSAGKTFERYARLWHYGADVPATARRGDIRHLDGTYDEIKMTSTAGANKGEVNFCQIRQSQHHDGYMLFVVEQDFRVVHLYLTKAQMAEELDNGSRPCHSDGTSRKMSFLWRPGLRDGRYEQFMERYLVNIGNARRLCCPYSPKKAVAAAKAHAQTDAQAALVLSS